MSEIIFSVIWFLVLAGILFVWLVRFLGEMGILSSENRLVIWCCSKKIAESREEKSRLKGREAFQVFGTALAIRIAVYIVGAAVCMLLSNYYSGRNGFSFTDFINSWNLWDSPHYIDLAKFGYQNCVENGQHLFLVFFPLYPVLIHIVHYLIGNYEVTAMLLSTLAFCVGSVFFYGVVKEEYNEEIAKRAFWLLSFFPFAFFFGGIMTESLFFCLLSAGFFCVKRHKWLAAGIVGMFCALCRVQGVLLLGVGLVEFFLCYPPGTMIRRREGKQFIKAFFKKGIFLFLTPIGNLIYFFINYQTEGDFFRFQVYQKEHWYHTTTWTSNCLKELVENALGDQNNMRLSIWYPEIILFLLAGILIIYALRRHPLKYTAFLLVYTMVNYSVTFLISGGRYMACALPMFIILAEWTQATEKRYYLILTVFTLLFGLYLAGYLTGQQIM